MSTKDLDYLNLSEVVITNAITGDEQTVLAFELEDILTWLNAMHGTETTPEPWALKEQ